MAEEAEDAAWEQSKNDLKEVKVALEKLKEAEGVYAAATTAFKASFTKAMKYLKEQGKGKSAERSSIASELQSISHCRPIKAPLILKFMLGDAINYYLPSPAAKLAYKQEYEKFKISATIGHLTLSLLGIFLIKSSSYDACVAFYMAVAYWMMLGREAVLKMNGSNVRDWWMIHHFLSMCLSAATIAWPHRYQARAQLYAFYLYVGFVQLLQYRYQMSRLYALRSLSRIDPMETTNELGQTLIHHNLLFLLPFLLIAYAWEFYLALVVGLGMRGGGLVGALYLALGMGNGWTTLYTYYRKLIAKRREVPRQRFLLTRHLTQSSEDLSITKKSE